MWAITSAALAPKGLHLREPTIKQVWTEVERLADRGSGVDTLLFTKRRETSAGVR